VKKIKAFFYVAYKSMVSPKYYREIFKTKFDFSIKYYVVLVLIAATITSVGTYLIEGPRARRVVTNILSEIETSYPDDLVFTIKGGEWEVNKPLPLIFEFPKTEMEVDKRFEKEPLSKNLIVLDKNGTVEDVEKYDTVILVNEKNVLVRKAGEPDVFPLKDIPDTTLDKTKVLTATTNAHNISGWVLPLAFMVPMFAGLMVYYAVFRGAYLLIVGALLFGVGKIMKVEVDFRNAFRTGLHAMTLPILVDMGLSIANYKVLVPFWFIIVNLSVGFLVLLEMRKGMGAELEKAEN